MIIVSCWITPSGQNVMAIVLVEGTRRHVSPSKVARNWGTPVRLITRVNLINIDYSQSLPRSFVAWLPWNLWRVVGRFLVNRSRDDTSESVTLAFLSQPRNPFVTFLLNSLKHASNLSLWIIINRLSCSTVVLWQHSFFASGILIRFPENPS